MATGTTYGGREFKAFVGVQDQSSAAIGTDTADANTVTSTLIEMRVDNPVNAIAWDGGYMRNEVERGGTRIFRAEDIINPYKGGIWTWDFSWTVDNIQGFWNLLNLIYPSNQHGANHANGWILPASPTVDDMKHGAAGATDTCAVVIIKRRAGSADDHYMHSCVLQNLTIGQDVGTNGGALTCSGQFMTGYRPVIEDNGEAADSSASTTEQSLFDMTTRTLGTDEVSVKSWSMTFENPASRVGFQGSNAEADGYVRAGRFGATGSITVKADDTVQDMLVDHWQANLNQALVLTHSTAAKLDISAPSVSMSGFNVDRSDEGMYVEIPFTMTSGADGSGNVCVIKSAATGS